MSELNILIVGFSAIILFLFGLESFSKEIQRISGEKFRLFLARATKVPFIGLLIGGLVTSIIQSSSATSVITMGLVNGGVITFKGSLSIIFGANIGTTITSQLVAFKLTNFAPYIIVLGFAFSVIKTRWSFLGKAIFYFGFVFFSLNLISDAVTPLKDHPLLVNYLIKPQGMFAALIIGALFTAIVQSSSVTTGVVIIFAQSGLISLENAVPIIIGSNIGTTLTVMLAIFSMDIPAKRTALSHLFFNLGGVLLFLPFIVPIINYLQDSDPAIALANVHLAFNLVSGIIFTIFINIFCKVIEKILPNNAQNDLFVFEFPQVSDSSNISEVNKFLDKSFDELFLLLKQSYSLLALSSESNHEKNFATLKRRMNYFDLIQKDFNRFYSKLINLVDKRAESENFIIFISKFEYLYQVHDSLKDIVDVKDQMDEMSIEMQADLLLHYKEITSQTLSIFELLQKSLSGETKDQHLLINEFSQLQATLNNFSKLIFKIMPDTNRSDTGYSMHFMTYSQRLKDKLSNLFQLIKGL